MNTARPRGIGARIRAELEQHIVSGTWPPGRRVPSEHALMTEYGCSRMTVNKALSAMAASGLVVRRRRAGSFVADPQGERAVMRIQDFASEAARLGVGYRHEILSRRVEPRERRLHVRCLHLMNELPSAYEDRMIALDAVPAAEGEPFRDAPPGTWLLRNVPWTEAEHVIRARNAGGRIGGLLGLKPEAACLVLERRTWHQGMLVTEVTITYPADRYWFVGRFSPVSGA